MKIVPNPEYQNAPFELDVFPVECSHNECLHRFNQQPPKEVWNDEVKLWEWIKANSIDPCIKVED